MKHSILAVTAFFILLSGAHAGVTIHYEGRAASAEMMSHIIAAATAFAIKHGWKLKDASSENGSLTRVINQKKKDYKGKITGIVLYPGEKCEPLHIQFGDDLFMQDFVKTQFAGADLHIEIISLLEVLKTSFGKLDVYDEGNYWEIHDRAALENHMGSVNKMIEDIKREDPKAAGPITLPSGRIVDIIQ